MTHFRGSLQEFEVGLYRLSDFAKIHEFIGRMAAFALARTEFQTGEWHEGLVAQSGRTEGFAAKSDDFLHKRMVHVYARRAQPETA